MGEYSKSKKSKALNAATSKAAKAKALIPRGSVVIFSQVLMFGYVDQ